MTSDGEGALAYYDTAKSELVKAGWGWEIDSVRGRSFAEQDAESFLQHYVYVVFNSGLNHDVADEMYKGFVASACDPKTVKHLGKRKALETALQNQNYRKWWAILDSIEGDEYRLDFIRHMPYMGPITSCHLARNLGLDVAKPDRWLARLAKRFGFRDAQELCGYVAGERRERIGVVDLVLWRYARAHTW